MKRYSLRNKIACAVVSLSVISTAAAQDQPIQSLPTDTLTLQTCLDIGLLNNYALRIAHNLEQISSNNATAANAGYLPTLDLSGSYRTTVDNTSTTLRSTGEVSTDNNVFDQTINLGVTLNWTIFDGLNIQANYQKLKELERQGETNTRIAIEDFVAGLTAEYYNYIQQKLRLQNFRYSMELSRERLRIVEERYRIGNFSGLDYQQAKVDYNADHASYLKQQEALQSSVINLNEWMAMPRVDAPLCIKDTIIMLKEQFDYQMLWESTLLTNASLLRTDQDITIAQLDYKKVISRNYPYVSLNAGYGYTYNKYDINVNSKRNNFGFNGGVTVGINIWDGNRRRERQNANIAVRNTQLQRDELEQALRAGLSNLWQSYQNNLKLVHLESQNLITAKDNYSIAMDRYMLGDLSGIEMREAQKSLLDAEERLLSSRFNTKLCEISLLQISGNVMIYLQ